MVSEEELKSYTDIQILDLIETQKGSKECFKALMYLSDDRKLSMNNEILKEELGLSEEQIVKLYESIKDEKKKRIALEKDEIKKIKLIEDADLEDGVAQKVVKKFKKDKNKIIILKKGKFLNDSIVEILASIENVEDVIDFYINHKDILIKRDVQIYSIIQKLSEKQQYEFLQSIETGKLKVTSREMNFIYASLTQKNKEKVRQKYNGKEIPQKVEQALNMKLEEKKKIDGDDEKRVYIDLNGDLEKYRGWDEMIRIVPTEFSEEERKKFVELCKICPNMRIYADEGGLILRENWETVQDYIEAEKWVEEVINKIKPKWNKLEKIAFIDNQIGKKITFIPEVETEVTEYFDGAQIWKTINTTYGKCVGISRIGAYLLKRIGIESDIIYTIEGEHAFLRIKNVEIIKKYCRIIKGDTLIDITWNLKANYFGSYPKFFCISYQDIRKADKLGYEDDKTHQSEELATGVTIGLDEEELENFYNKFYEKI